MSNTTLPDIERAALTLLAQCKATHPELVAWCGRLISDADYTDSLPDPLRDDLSNCRAQSNAYADAEQLEPEYAAEDEIEANWQRGQDEAILLLGSAIIRFRRDGRPAGDVSRELHGVGGPFMTVTSSLAADVVNFFRDIRNVDASRTLASRRR